jgi:hypothetical protein
VPTWYLLLWGLVLVLAIFTRSLVAYLAMLFVWVLGVYFATNIVAIEVVRIGIIGVFVLGVGYTAIEMVANVNKF